MARSHLRRYGLGKLEHLLGRGEGDQRPPEMERRARDRGRERRGRQGPVGVKWDFGKCGVEGGVKIIKILGKVHKSSHINCF